jgi:hypothetical protein
VAIRRYPHAFRRKTRADVATILNSVRVTVTRTIAASLVALVLLLLLAAAIPGASVATVGPVEASICLESGGGHAQYIDAPIQPLSTPMVGVTSAAGCLGVPALAPKVRSHTRGVLRL